LYPQNTGQVYGFGSSAISQLDNAYTQNIHDSIHYAELQLSGKMTEIRCEPLDEKQKVLRDTIERLMCNRHLRVDEREKEILGAGWERLLALESEGLLTKVSDDEIRTTELGALVIRYLAMQLDPLMQNRKTEGVFSKTI
jgi:oxygen-independent coproporphyrinogen-3 oxidase